jgi:hypothetical protein
MEKIKIPNCSNLAIDRETWKKIAVQAKPHKELQRRKKNNETLNYLSKRKHQLNLTFN